MEAAHHHDPPATKVRRATIVISVHIGRDVTGLLCALRQQGKKPSDLVNQRIVVAGAGSAGLGVANALTDAMVLEGMSEEDARANFWIVDVRHCLTGI